MKKDILTVLKAMDKSGKRSTKRHVLECREDIQKGLDAGFPLKKIWAALVEMGKVTYTYAGFVRVVKRTILDPRKSPPSAPSPTPPPATEYVADHKKGYVVTRRNVAPEQPKEPEKIAVTVTEENDGIAPGVLAGLAKLRKGGTAFQPEGGYFPKK